jgi:hypothetical protein
MAEIIVSGRHLFCGIQNVYDEEHDKKKYKVDSYIDVTNARTMLCV